MHVSKISIVVLGSEGKVNLKISKSSVLTVQARASRAKQKVRASRRESGNKHSAPSDGGLQYPCLQPQFFLGPQFFCGVPVTNTRQFVTPFSQGENQ